MDRSENAFFKIPKFESLIIWENDDLIVVNKPAFLSTLDERTTAGQESGNSLLRLAKQYHNDAQLCHRIDKETSGLLLVAKNPETYRSISMLFEHRRIEKKYHAVIHGNQTFNDLMVDLPILNLGNKNVSIDRQKGKEAQTWFNSLEYFKHYTLVECRPVTGRMHQIRIHLATQRAAIVGDDLYGGKPVYLSQIKKGFTLGRDQEERPIIQRFALHARQLEFELNGETYSFEAPYPKDFSTLLKQLRRFDTVNF